MFDVTPTADESVTPLPPAQFAGVVRVGTGRRPRSAWRTNSCGMNTEQAR